MSAGVATGNRVTLGDLARQSPPQVDGETAEHGEQRRAAAAWVATRGFPVRKDEDWRYVDLRPLLELPFIATDLGDGGQSRSLAARLGPGLGGPRLVLVNGRFAPSLSELEGLPPGARITALSTAIQRGDEAVGDLWGDPAAGWVHGFEALNVAFAVDGAIVDVADGARLDAPIEIVHVAVSSDGQPPACHPRNLLRVGAGGSVRVIETFSGTGCGGSLTNAHTRILLDEGARAEHFRLQVEPLEACHLSTVEVHPGPGARYTSQLLALGARLGRHELRVRLAGEGAVVDLGGLYLPLGAQCHDNPVRVDHIAPRCTSHQLYKGIVDNAGHGIFNGHLVVHPGATGTDASQVNKNLLLSDQAEVDARPRLEIFADDVACSHGAAVGQLDPDALFYLRSRGISEADARRLLIAGFAAEVLGRIPAGPIGERAESVVTDHLRHVVAQ